jgi:radical SAM protein with 4Fe4S-binding SPASM domain
MDYYVNIEDSLEKNGKKIFAIYGSGLMGDECLSFLEKRNIKVAFYIDSNPNKNFIPKNGILIMDPSILDKLPKEKVFIFIAVQDDIDFKEIADTLAEKGYMPQDYVHVNRKFINKVNALKTNTLTTVNYAKKHKFNEMPLFRRFEIETINRCNGKCAFCPVNAKDDPRHYAKMPDELFYKIISQLKELDYTGILLISSNNEPLLDERIISFANHVHNEVPRAFSGLFTNGTLLTLDKFKELVKDLDFILIDNYRNDYEFHPTVKQVYEYCLQHPNIAKKVRINKRLDNEVLTTRAGISPNAESCKVYGRVCPHPYSQMVIRPDGKVSLCCVDAIGQMTLGDINEQSILEIWNGKKYVQLREQLIKGSEFVPVCHTCDGNVGLIENPDPNDKYTNEGSLLAIGMNTVIWRKKCNNISEQG